jgi:adsorption protein B
LDKGCADGMTVDGPATGEGAAVGEALFALLAGVHRECLIFAIVGLALGGIDDLAIDIIYLCRRGWRNVMVYSRHRRMTTASLPRSPQPGGIAIFVPAWREADVIGDMLRHALASWGDADYRLFVGVYPNDPATIDAVARAAAGHAQVVMGVNERPGPSTKADCLNVLWRAMRREEARSGAPFKAVVLHDAEDVVHPDEIKIYDYMIDRFDLVQLPVLPVPGGGGWWSRAIANHYGDEFAEPHCLLA